MYTEKKSLEKADNKHIYRYIGIMGKAHIC